MTRILLAAVALAAFSGAADAATTTVEFDASTNGATPSQDPTARFTSFTLDAGSYSVTLFDGTYTALSVWSSNSGCNPAGFCDNGWFASYTIIDDAGDELLSYSSSTIRSLATDALADALADGPQTFTNPTDQTLYVGLFDNPLTDNRGGMSLHIEQATPVPLPAGGILALSGLAALSFLRRRAR